MATLYVIPNWERDFENSKSRQVEKATFFCVPNHFDGRAMKRLSKLKNPEELYGSFHAICAIASKCPYRGVLLDEHRGPLTALDLSDKTVFGVKALDRALKELSDPVIGLLEKHEVEEVDGAWPLPAAVCRWAVHYSARRRSASHAGHAQTRSDTERQQPRSETKQPTAPKTPPDIPPRPPVSPDIPPRIPSDTERHGATRREGNGREEKYPLPSPLQGDSAPAERPPAADLITDPKEAKRLICQLILDGKNPARLWSPDAENRLHDMCKKEGGIPLREIQTISWWRKLPKNDEIPELKKRFDPITETGLMTYWGDELQRATDYLKKVTAKNGGGALTKKAEPPRWREFMQWKHENPTIDLPKSFFQLSKDHQAAYFAEFQTFENCVPAPEAAT